MVQDADVAAHYTGGSLLAAIESGLEQLDRTLDTATIDDLAPVDEFHIGGRPATSELCRQLDLAPGSHVLDIGCGIGGTARFISNTFGCTVHGIDLTPEYIDVARTLSHSVGFDDQHSFTECSALATPFDDESFDAAVQLHVGMNIAHKVDLFQEVFRLLRPGGVYGIYDIMRTGDGDVAFPVPWASDASMSFTATPDDYFDGLESAGFQIRAVRDRSDFATEFFTALRQRSAASSGPPPLGLHLIMGPNAPMKIGNMIEAVTSGRLGPVEIVVSKPASA